MEMGGLLITLCLLNVCITGCFSITVRESYFWQITDMHWDSGYSRTGDVSNMCLEQARNGSVGSARDNGYYGNYSCDAPFSLVSSAIYAMSYFQQDPDFILWTGDMLPHRYNNVTQNDSLAELRNITELLVSLFPNATIIPVFGNNDIQYRDQMPENDTTFYSDYLSFAAWDLVIPPEANTTFNIGGYYSVRVKDGLEILALNTILYKLTNKMVSEEEDDPAGQFQWMTSKLQSARDEGRKVIITAHCPPGYNLTLTDTTFKPKFNDRYINLVLNYSDVIIAHVYGHVHRDLFQLYVNEEKEVLGYSLVAPSVSPLGSKTANLYDHGLNPAIRKYKYDMSQSMITDYYQYMLNLSLANENYRNAGQKSDQWSLLYQFTSEYSVPDLSLESMLHHYNDIRTDNNTLEKFNRHFIVDYYPPSYNETLRLLYICNLGFTKENLMNECIQDGGQTTISLAPLKIEKSTSVGSQLLTLDQNMSGYCISVLLVAFYNMLSL